MKKYALITGAGGFIGSHLVEHLVVSGYQVKAMVRYNSQNRWGWLDSLPKKITENITILSGDIRDYQSVRKAVSGCNIVFHLAALIGIPYSYNAPSSYVDTNISGTLNIAQACLEEGVDRLIHTSTSETYGTAQYVPIDEKHPLVGQSPYSATKIAADKLIESFYLSFELPATIIRPFNTYGPRQSARAVIPTVISQALEGKEKILLGSLSPIRDLTFVKDTVRAFVAAAESNNSIGQLINIGNGKGISVGELSKLILKICNSKASITCETERIRPEKSEVRELICNNKVAKEILEWYPKYSLENGIEETVAWLKNNLNHYKSGIYNL
jgi:NAD dependent epimerase/dehydratase